MSMIHSFFQANYEGRHLSHAKGIRQRCQRLSASAIKIAAAKIASTPHPIALPVIISREKKSTRKFPTPATPRTASLLSRESEVNGTAAAATQCTSAPTCVLSCRAATELPHKSSLSLLLFAACKAPRTDGGDDSQGSSARARQQQYSVQNQVLDGRRQLTISIHQQYH